MMNTPSPTLYPISRVEQLTGIPRDLLRMWERRYGYPKPDRDAQGDRIYTDDDVVRLGLIAALIEQGRRPGKLVTMPLESLQALHAEYSRQTLKESDQLLPVLDSCDIVALRQWLEQQLAAQGLRLFVLNALPRFNEIVGESWQQGAISIHQEHLYTEQLKRVLRQAIASLPVTHQRPRVLLTTLSGEQHTLGLLMVETVLRLQACAVIPLGAETPVEEIAAAARIHQADIIGVSFSAAYPRHLISSRLQALRTSLPATVELWAGGNILRNLDVEIPDVQLTPQLSVLEDAIAAWRTRLLPVI